MRPFLRTAYLLGLFSCLASSADAQSSLDAKARAELTGQPTALLVQPGEVVLGDARAYQQLVVTGQYADKQVRDLTHAAEYTIEGDAAVVAEPGLVRPVKDGKATLVVKAGNQTAKVAITVKDQTAVREVSFHREVIGALNVSGCNMGACHGTPSGKNGFRLSLRGYDPDADHLQLTRDILGRRTSSANPEQSLLLQKGTGRTVHEGGARMSSLSEPYKVIHQWMAEGALNDPTDKRPLVQKLEVLPGGRVFLHPAQSQQLAVLATFSNGETRDVTRLSVFSSSDAAVGDVDRHGLVEFKQPGEIAVLVRYLETMETVRLTYLKPNPSFKWSNPPEHNFVDQHVFNKLKMLNILPSETSTDQEFLRRAYMDLCGVLPSGAEAKEFLDSKEANKRAKLVDILLDRTEFADFWTLKWADVLRNNRKTLQLQGAHKFQEWIRGYVAQDRGLDEMVTELLTSGGSTYSNPPANYYRVAKDPTSLAETTAQLFFGVRMQCAKCHNHPFERWTQDDYYSLAAFFARVKNKRDPLNDVAAKPNPMNTGAEVVYLDRAGEVTQPRTSKTMPPRFPGGIMAKIGVDEDRRISLAKWLTEKDNPFFAKSVVNRVWFHLLGKGIVDPVDDFRDSNPSCNDELLTALAQEFIAKGFRLKPLIRTIMISQVYQLSAQTNDFNRDDNKYFSHAVTKLHSAEQLLDAICSATSVPEKFAGMPAGTRATQLPDGEINHVFLKTFGQPARELACECEREGDSNLAQALQLINGPTIHDKLRAADNRIGLLLKANKSDQEIATELYLATLSRPPLEGELKAVQEHLNKAQPMDKRKAWEDVHWALINSKEFLFRH